MLRGRKKFTACKRPVSFIVVFVRDSWATGVPLTLPLLQRKVLQKQQQQKQQWRQVKEKRKKRVYLLCVCAVSGYGVIFDAKSERTKEGRKMRDEERKKPVTP